MIITRDQNHGEYEIRSYRPGCLTINEQSYGTSLLVGAHRLTSWSPQSIEQVQPADFDPILSWHPDVVILGTGENLNFPSSQLLKVFYENQIGIEVMSTIAACRTFNVLMAESRNVVAALIIR